MVDHGKRIQDFKDWILYGTINPDPFRPYGSDDDITARLDVCARAAQEYQDRVNHPVNNGDWICGCGELLGGAEPICWKCGGSRPRA